MMTDTTSPASGALPALPSPDLWIDGGSIKGYCTRPGPGPWFTAQDMRDYARAALASREASSAPLTRKQIDDAQDAADAKHGVFTWGESPGSWRETFANEIARSVVALASPQVAPDPKPLDDPKLQQWFGDAIEGAMAFGFMGNNPPPEGHWLTRFWNIGRAEATKAAPVPGLAQQSAADALEHGGVAVGSDGEWVSVRRHVRDAAVAALRGAAPAPVAPTPESAAYLEARDMILNDRGPLEGEGLTSEQTNAVLAVLDDAFSGVEVAPTPAQPSDAEIVMGLLDGGGWELHRIPAWAALTDEANREQAWGVRRTDAPYCDKRGDRQWTGPTAMEAFRKAFKALRMKFPAPLPSEPEGRQL